jgi:hypothetical protein
LEAHIRACYEDQKFEDPAILWAQIRTDFEKLIKRDGRWEITILSNAKMEDFQSITEWQAFQNRIIKDLTICSVTLDETICSHWTLEGLLQTGLYSNFVQTLELNGADTSINKIFEQLLSLEARLKGNKESNAVFIMQKQKDNLRKGKSKNPNKKLVKDSSKDGAGSNSGPSKKDNERRNNKTCSACRKKGHKMED